MTICKLNNEELIERLSYLEGMLPDYSVNCWFKALQKADAFQHLGKAIGELDVLREKTKQLEKRNLELSQELIFEKDPTCRDSGTILEQAHSYAAEMLKENKRLSEIIMNIKKMTL